MDKKSTRLGAFLLGKGFEGKGKSEGRRILPPTNILRYKKAFSVAKKTHNLAKPIIVDS